MPELPEVETIKRDLGPLVTGKRILEVRILPDPGGLRALRRYPSRQRFNRRLRGAVIRELKRRAKYLLFHLITGDTLIIHLGMSGQLLYRKQTDGLDRFTRILFRLDGGYELRFIDPRKFGETYLYSENSGDTEVELSVLGPEPLSRSFTAASLRGILRERKRPIKSLLMDQRLISGIGNIYSDEILFAAGLHPLRPASTLRDREIRDLHEAIRSVLARAIRLRGTSVSDYRNGFGNSGGFQKRLMVYQRGGEKCRRCQGIIMSIKIQGRTSYFCPRCQS
ncbi:MAG: bifunctional DNA-formamidopyrimidine glycosylase/DNA-(apurinic or apyrimidinic site) lyase [Deltaproteobacteria bacterium]|nr:MAG: bifunctional DNA-formamidopyrimidine glycosylase/DNA-(apurinic or apyrimidinic site) lyase [Deltaproteobacteria bacterium]